MKKALGMAVLFLMAIAPAMAGQSVGNSAQRTFAPMPVMRTFSPPVRSFDPIRQAEPLKQTASKFPPPKLPVRTYYPTSQYWGTYEERYNRRPHCAAIPPPTQYIMYGCLLYPFALGIVPEDS